MKHDELLALTTLIDEYILLGVFLLQVMEFFHWVFKDDRASGGYSTLWLKRLASGAYFGAGSSDGCVHLLLTELFINVVDIFLSLDCFVVKTV